MANLDSLFKEYLSRIEPSETAVKRAKAAHEPLREDLENDTQFGPYVSRTLLSGSYGRDTAIFSIKDVDVIIQTTFTRQGLWREKLDGETEQACLLRLTKEAIKRTGRDARTRTARRSVHVKLPEEVNDIEKGGPDLTMDIVPVLIVADQDTDPMQIADHELKGWYDTYPLGQLGDSEDRNAQSKIIGDRHSYKPLVKIMKAWKRVHFYSKKTPKGFILECLTASYHNPQAEHWAEAVRDLFKDISQGLPAPEYLIQIPQVHDIANAAPYQIPIAKTLEEAKEVLTKIHDHLALIEQAIEEAETDLTKSAKTLRRVFGQDGSDVCFPLPSDLDGGNGGGKKSSPFVPPRSRSDVREAPPFG